MRVCLIGDYSNRPDEGYRNIIDNLTREIGKVSEIRTINVQPPRVDNLIAEARRFRPDIIHYFSAPTLSSFLITRLARKTSGNGARTVVSCLHPNGYDTFSNTLSRFIAFNLRPDLALVQNEELGAILRKSSFSIAELPNGVDLDRFKPVSDAEKRALREKYGVDQDTEIVLHVGHVVRNRGLGAMVGMMRRYEDVQGIVVGSSHFEPDQTIIEDLRGSGCLVWLKHFENIEEIYQLSDAYAFPVQERGSVFMPLSVMEAMACNLPVITVRSDTLRHWFGDAPGLHYVGNEGELIDAVSKVRDHPPIDSRSLLSGYSWHDVASRLMNIYGQLTGAGE